MRNKRGTKCTLEKREKRKRKRCALDEGDDKRPWMRLTKRGHARIYESEREREGDRAEDYDRSIALNVIKPFIL